MISMIAAMVTLAAPSQGLGIGPRVLGGLGQYPPSDLYQILFEEFDWLDEVAAVLQDVIQQLPHLSAQHLHVHVAYQDGEGVRDPDGRRRRRILVIRIVGLLSWDLLDIQPAPPRAP